MSLRNMQLVICGVVVALSATSVEILQAQPVAEPAQSEIKNPATPTPANQTAPTPQVGPDPVESAAGGAGAAAPNVLAPAVQSNRRPTRATPASSVRSNRNNNAYSPRLARAAPIMGDTLSPSLALGDIEPQEIPQAGGATRAKIAENSSSLPLDRLIFNYNHFHNAVDEGLAQPSSDLDRFTLGFERTFFDQMASIEVRMPFVADNDFVDPADFARNGSDVGNLSVTLKGVLTADQDSLIAAGMTIDTPTGGDTIFTDFISGDVIAIGNDAVHLSPFLGFLCAPRSGRTHQGFLQVDVPTNGNNIVINGGGAGLEEELLEQTLLYVDYSFSQELFNAGRSRRNNGNLEIQRILGLAEVHYTTTLEDSDVAFAGVNQISSFGNRIDVVNITLGLHTELKSGTQLRLGTVAPITDDDDRFFDFEFQAQLNVLLR